jgi:predicted component of type VI protein secretion system
MLETFLKVLIVVNFLTTFAICVYVAKRQCDYCITKDEVIASQEERIQRLFAENVALETKAIQNTNFGNDFIAQPVHGEHKPVRINLTTLDKEKSGSASDWSLEFECQTDPSTW